MAMMGDLSPCKRWVREKSRRHWIRLTLDLLQELEFLEGLSIPEGRETDARQLVGERASSFVVVRATLQGEGP